MDEGRALDALIAEKVMGYAWRRFDYPPAGLNRDRGRGNAWRWLSSPACGSDISGDETRYIENVPRYSTDIAAAWLVINRLHERGWNFSIEDARTTQGLQWRVALWNEEAGTPEDAFSPNPAHAICLAALQAVAALTPSTPEPSDVSPR